MITFGDYLYNIMQRYNLTISSIASKAKIDRTLLSKAISGSRSLNRITFKKLLVALEPTQHESETLTELYAVSYFGESSYTRIQLLKKYMLKHTELNSFSKHSIPLPGLNSVSKTALNDFGKALESNFDVKNCISMIFENEWNSVNPKLYTNYPFDLDFINDLMLHYIDTNNKQADFRHLVCFSANNSINDEMQIFLNSILYQQKGYETKFYISGNNDNHNFDIIYPYYIISKDSMILFEKSLNSGILITVPEFVAAYTCRFISKIDSCNTVVSSLKDHKNTRDLFLPYCTNSHEMLSFSKNLSMFITDKNVHLLEYDINDYSSIRYLQELCDINSHMLEDFSFYTLILYKSAITDFISDGIIHGIPKEKNITVPEKNRHEFLSNILSFLNQKNVSFSITNDNIEQLSDNIMITVLNSETYQNNIVFTNIFSHQNIADIKHSYVTITNSAMVKTYCNFLEYLFLFSYTETTETSIEYFEKQTQYTSRLYG